jgi:methylsterol monooxygenase/4-alpha-methyl-delta7-sterol-4alpha-methyl oxidase
MLCEDFTFYWTHRSLHWRVIYPYIHKWHHSYKTTVCIAVEHSHPIEYLYSSLLSVSVGPMLLGERCHAVTVLAWYVWHTCESIDGHCGYAFPWSPFRLVPFSAGEAFHDYHHSENVGNYGSYFRIWDTLFDTNKDFVALRKQKSD